MKAVTCMEDKQWTHKSSQLRKSAKNTILSPVTPKSDNDGVNSGMGRESRSVNNALLTLKTSKNMGDYPQDMDFAFHVLLGQTADSHPATAGENFANDPSQGS